MAHDASNKNFQYAADCINYSNRSLFLTGKAGTGKTTFLKYIREHTQKQNAVVAPTGVAAINAGGVTIHSFFQLPFTPYVPSSPGFSSTREETVDRHSLLGRMRFNRERIKLLQQLELLIIDEISMVRCDVLDAIDAVLRHFRNRYHEPFGGVQVLLIGDLFQLPPVASGEEWNILSRFYNSTCFFDSKVMEQFPPLYIELEKIYRQSDHNFISLLNAVRNNAMENDDIQLLQNLYKPAFKPTKGNRYVTLCTHNYKADAINAEELQQLGGKLFEFKATVEKEFSEKAYPADEILRLKVGSQVMFIKNDIEERKYFNGKLGVVQKIDNEKILIQCADEPSIEVKKETWKNIRYSLNENSQKVEEEEIGSFKQYPLRLAWAITIHKSQGLTFERAIIDAGNAFAPGQVYVALSRCTSLEGVVLRSHITASSLFTDPHIAAFSSNRKNSTGLTEELDHSKCIYQQSILTSLFNFENLLKQIEQIITMTEDHKTAFNEETMPWLQNIQSFIAVQDEVAKKFQTQLQQYLKEEVSPEANNKLQERVKAAAIYFDDKLQTLKQLLPQSPAITDSRQYALSYNEDLKELFTSIAFKQQLIHSCVNGFTVEHYQKQKNAFILPGFYINAYAKAAANPFKDNPHPALIKDLRKLRDEICEENDLPIYIVAGSQTLDEMARYLPQTLNELAQISGFGKAKVDKYGQQFIDIINTYCDKHSLSTRIEEKQPKRKRKEPGEAKAPKVDTKLESFKLYKEGKTIIDIAAARNLAAQTIEGHLAHYVESGEIPIGKLLSMEKILLIEPVARTFTGGALTPLKEQLGDAVNFGDIKLVLAHIEYEKYKPG